MSLKHLFYIAFAAIFLSGCGLDTDEEADDGTAVVVVDIDQNPYLPLTNNTAILYTDAGANVVTAAISYDVGMSGNRGFSVYKLAMTGGSQDLNLYFRTTPSQIELVGLDGPITLSSQELDYVRFTTPVKLVGNFTGQTTSASADINGSSVSSSNISVTYATTNDTATPFASNGWNLPTLHSRVNADIDANGISFSIALNFYFTRGLGLVQNSLGSSFEIAFQSLDGLPNVMAFRQDGNEINGRSVFSLAPADGAINASKYKIVNQDALDALSWLDITSTSSDLYQVAVQTGAAGFHAHQRAGTV